MSHGLGPEAEEIHAPTGPGFAETVTLAFGEPAAGICGLVRVALAGGGARAVGALFQGHDLVAAERTGALEPPAEPTWSELEAGPVRHTTDAPLEAWRVAFAGRDGGFELAFKATGDPAAYEIGPLSGYDQLCRVEGTVHAGGTSVPVSCLGQRGHAWGEPDWQELAAVRHVSLWREDGEAVLLTALRPAGAPGHEDDAVAGFAVLGEDPALHVLDDARLSTTFDGAGRQRRAGLELWSTPEAEYPRRAAGEAVCGTCVELGPLRLDCAFFAWRMEGRTGLGRYDVLHPA